MLFNTITAPQKSFVFVPDTGHEPSTTALQIIFKVLIEQVKPLTVNK